MDILFRRKNIAAAAALLSCIIMIIFPSEALLSAQKGIAIWAGNVLPALLPFFICAGFMNSMGVSLFLPRSLYIFAMSVFSGYPMGARIIGDMRRKGEISLYEAQGLMPLGSTTGPAFIFGAVGAGMFGSVMAGAIIAASHYIGAIITDITIKILISDKWSNKSRLRSARQHVDIDKMVLHSDVDVKVLDMFTNSILEALKALGIILAYIVIFMFATDMMQKIRLFANINDPLFCSIIKGLMEMTVGCSALSDAAINISGKIIAASFLISFGGFSVIGQSMSMLAESGISFGYFLLVKLLHGICAALLAVIFTMVFAV